MCLRVLLIFSKGPGDTLFASPGGGWTSKCKRLTTRCRALRWVSQKQCRPCRWLVEQIHQEINLANKTRASLPPLPPRKASAALRPSRCHSATGVLSCARPSRHLPQWWRSVAGEFLARGRRGFGQIVGLRRAKMTRFATLGKAL